MAINIRLRKTVVRCGLILFSVFLAVVVTEIVLSIFFPRYENLINQGYVVDTYRIMTTSPNTRIAKRHPDENYEFSIYYNRAGLRQNRDFSEPKGRTVTRIGIFGDSFTENVAMEAQYMFTEVLDYLLNMGDEQFEVLNFGVSGYGLDQIYLRYMDEGRKLDLDYVIYVMCGNDIRNVYENELFVLGDEGELENTNRKRRPFPLFELVRNYRITYLLIDAHARLFKGSLGAEELMRHYVSNAQKRMTTTALDNRKDPKFRKMSRKFSRMQQSEEVLYALRLFRALLDRFEREVENDGAEFLITFPPFQGYTPAVRQLLIDRDSTVLDLEPCFIDNGVTTVQSITFVNDGHWNEEANKVAAVCMFSYLAKNAYPALNQINVEHSLYKYYSPFNFRRVSQALTAKTQLDPDESVKIIEMYKNYDVK